MSLLAAAALPERPARWHAHTQLGFGLRDGLPRKNSATPADQGDLGRVGPLPALIAYRAGITASAKAATNCLLFSAPMSGNMLYDLFPRTSDLPEDTR